MQVNAVVLSVMVVAVPGCALAQTGPLAGERLRAAVAGKTVSFATPAGAVPIRYRADGTMVGQSNQVLAPFLGSERDHGRWWIAGDQLCQRWSNWLEGKSHCYKLRRLGRIVHWTRNDGRRGTATLSR
jgi:hypothetical protein